MQRPEAHSVCDSSEEEHLRKMDDSLLQASSDLGASGSATLYRIVIPLLNDTPFLAGHSTVQERKKKESPQK